MLREQFSLGDLVAEAQAKEKTIQGSVATRLGDRLIQRFAKESLLVIGQGRKWTAHKSVNKDAGAARWREIREKVIASAQ